MPVERPESVRSADGFGLTKEEDARAKVHRLDIDAGRRDLGRKDGLGTGEPRPRRPAAANPAQQQPARVDPAAAKARLDADAKAR